MWSQRVRIGPVLLKTEQEIENRGKQASFPARGGCCVSNDCMKGIHLYLMC